MIVGTFGTASGLFAMFVYDIGIASGGVLQTSESDCAIPPAEQLAT